jgi:hypothetical protein
VECKATSNIPDLNTAISLLYCAARSLLPSAPRLQECIDHLVMALLTRFNYTWDGRDVTNALVLQIATLTNGLNEDHLVDTVSTTSMGDLIEIEDCLGINLFGEEPLEPHSGSRKNSRRTAPQSHSHYILAYFWLWSHPVAHGPKAIKRLQWMLHKLSLEWVQNRGPRGNNVLCC